MVPRKKLSAEVVAEILVACRRRCCLCAAIGGDYGEKKGQIAHLDRDPSNGNPDNLAYLCLEHHDVYDSRSSQTRGLTLAEVRRYRTALILEPIGRPAEHDAHRTSLHSDWIGVLNSSACVAEVPKREFLLFDKVAVIGLESALALNRTWIRGQPQVANELEHLERRGLLMRVDAVPNGFSREVGREKNLGAILRLLELGKKSLDENSGPPDDHGRRLHRTGQRRATDQLWLSHVLDVVRGSLVARAAAEYLRITGVGEAVSAHGVPGFSYEERPTPGQHDPATDATLKVGSTLGHAYGPTAADPKADVARVVLHRFPYPLAATSIDEIVGYKTDPEARHHLLGLRLWMNEVAILGLSPKELADKLEWLLREYEVHLARHRLKWRHGTLEAVVATSAQGRQGETTAKGFSVRRTCLSLLEGEMAAPGRQVAYLARIASRFARSV